MIVIRQSMLRAFLGETLFRQSCELNSEEDLSALLKDFEQSNTLKTCFNILVLTEVLSRAQAVVIFRNP